MQVHVVVKGSLDMCGSFVDGKRKPVCLPNVGDLIMLNMSPKA